MSETDLEALDETDRFLSFAALRAAHNEVLQKQRANGETMELVQAIESFLRRGQATGVWLDDDDERRAAQSLLNYWVTTLYSLDREPPDASLAEFDLLLAPSLPDSLCPYVGLYPFNEKDTAHFFGRSALVNSLLKKLDASSLLAVVGASGSGKSSVVRAGLIPALKAGRRENSATWHYLDYVLPGSKPFVNLLSRLNPMDADSEWIAAHAQTCLRDPKHLTTLLAQQNLAPAVLVIDQFEELFSLAPENERAPFALTLWRAAEAGHTIIITLRADFAENVSVLTEFYKPFRSARVDVEAMDASEIREAIELPARSIGLKLEPGLTDKLLGDVLGKPAALPLLQFTLSRLWEERDHNRLTLAAYQRIGGNRALAQAADEFYNSLEALPEEQNTAEWLFKQLVQPVPDSLEFTSRRISRDWLLKNGPASDRVERILYALIAKRLVRESAGEDGADTQVEVAHEALIRNWGRLVEWLEDERENLRERRRIEADAADWATTRDETRLYRGTRLEEVTRQSRAASGRFSIQVMDFLRASQELAEAEQTAREAARQTERDLANARALASQTEARIRAEANGRRVATWLVVLAVGTAFVASFFAFQSSRNADLAATNSVKAQTNAAAAEVNAQTAEVARTQAVGQATVSAGLANTAESLQGTAEADRNKAATAQVEAETERDIAATAQAIAQAALSRQLAAQGRSFLSSDLNLALLLGVAAFKTSETTEAANLLQDGIDLGRSRTIEPLAGRPIPAQSGVIQDLTFSPDGSILAWAGPGGSVSLWDLNSQKLTVLAGHPEFVQAVAFSPDGQWLASVDASGIIIVWNLSAKKLEYRLNPHVQATALRLAFSPNSQMLAVGYSDGEINLWDTASKSLSIALSGLSHEVRGLAWSPDGQYIAAGGLDKLLRIWDAETGDKVLTPPSVHLGSVWGVVWSTNGKWIVTSGGLDRTLVIWDATNGNVISQTATDHTSDVISIALSHDQKLLASSSRDRSIYLWDLTDPQKIRQVAQIQGSSSKLLIALVAFSPADNVLAYTSGLSVQLSRITLPPSSDQPLSVQACELAGRDLNKTEWEQYFPGQDYQKTCN